MIAQSEISIGEKILAIMALATKEVDKKKLSYDAVFSAFKKIAESNPDEFPEIYFSDFVGKAPYSKKLEKILFRLGSWGGISIENPYFRYLKVTDRVFNSIEDDILKSYGKDTFTKLKQLSDRFIEEIPSDKREN